MSAKELIGVARAFRKGLLEGAPSRGMCAIVTLPLQGMLSAWGVESEYCHVFLDTINHVFLKLPDGRVLDATADQFDGFPDVYLGAPQWIHRNAVEKETIQ
jgi:hypothetical protein